MTFRFRSPLIGSAILLLLPAQLLANPTGGSVAAGSATIVGQGTSAVTVKQGSNTTIINWQSFSINSGESTSFLQPGANSAALNRVLGGQMSLINGTLSANGQVYLVNGNGVIIGPGGVINANAFTASTRDIADADFLSGNLHFTGSSDAGVQNLGTINALGGNVALIGRTVDNEGTITAPRGTVGLIAGDDVLLAQNNADGSTITVSPVTMAAGTSAPVGVKNGGAITAAAAELKAANGNIYGLAVQNLGTIRATMVSHQGGHIWLTSDTGTVSNSGTLNASATVAGGQGGTVTLKSLGGTVSHTGQIIAQGGTGGAGGNAEISGAVLEFTGEVDLSAPGGTRGTLLLDPTTVDIVTGGGPDITASTVDPSAIVLALNSSDVIISASESITVDDEVDASANTNAGNLTLATPAVFLNAPIVLNGSLNGSANEVLLSANALVQNGIDAIGASGGTVTLAPGAVYGLTQEILINKTVELDGNGATLSGQGSTRVMEIDGGTVTLDDLVITGGNGDSSIGNAGAGNNGTGGGLLVYGQNVTSNVTIDNSTFVGNNGSAGGAMASVIISGGSNSILIYDCTLTGNSAINGSVLYNDAAFGPTSSVTFKADTVAANSGNGAIYNTVLSSGAAIVSFNNTILVGNTNFSGESDYVSGGGDTLMDIGYNLYGEDGNAGGFVPSGPGDVLLQGDISTAVAPLGLYGGDTPTMALVAGSPALEAGDPAYIEAPDQRGVYRGVETQFTGSDADIGAFEAQYVEVQANDATFLYGSTPVFSYTVTSGPAAAMITGTPELVEPATNTGFYGEDIGQGTVMATSPEFLVDFTEGDLTITQRPVTVDPDPDQGKTYGTNDPVLTYTTDPADAVSGLVNGDTLTGSPSYIGAGQYTSVGNYTTTLGTVADSTGNYIVSLSSAPTTFAITPRPVVVDVDAGQTKIYGTLDPTLTYTIEAADTTSGLVNGDTLTGAADYLGSGQFAGVGTYPTNTGTLANSNYLVLPGSEPATFAITPRTVTVLPDAGQSKVYGSPDPVLTYTTDPADATTGLVNGDTLIGSPSYNGAGEVVNVGTYPTNLGTVADSSGNYTVQLDEGAPTFAITPATLGYTADPVTIAVGAAIPRLTGEVSGFVGGDTLASATTGVALFSTEATSSSPQDYYAITGSGLTANNGNYVFVQAAVNSVALTIGNPPSSTPVIPVTPAMPATPTLPDGSTPAAQAAQPNTPIAQAIAQTTPTTSTSDPTTSLPGGTETPLVQNPAPVTVDINVTSISPNESIDATPAPAQASSSGSSDTGAMAQSSSFNPDVGATRVTGGQAVTVGGATGVPPPPIVQAQLNNILGSQAQDTLSGALALAGTGDDQGVPASTPTSTMPSTPTGGPASSTPAPAQAQTSATANPGGFANPNGPGATGPVTVIATGQTISFSGGKSNMGPPPVFIQAAFAAGFNQESHDTMAAAAGLPH